MTSNKDILAFLQADQDAKAKEKEVDKEIRARERKEDMEHILSLIKIGVEKEVKAALQETEQRLGEQEKINQELANQLKSVVKDMEALRAVVRDQQQAFPALSVPEGQGMHQSQDGGMMLKSRDGGSSAWGIESRRQEADYDNRRVEEICAAGRRVIGFTPIEPRMLELQIKSFGARNQEEAMLMEIKSYLKCEMKVRPSDIDKLDIVRIFHPAKENWNVLYVEFGNEYQVDKLFSYTRGMVKQDHRLVRWFPKQMYERYRAVESVAYEIRKSSQHKTRVKIGRNDIELSIRESGSTAWRRHSLPDNLPKIDLDCTFRSLTVSSPPPGRPGRPQADLSKKSEEVAVIEPEHQI